MAIDPQLLAPPDSSSQPASVARAAAVALASTFNPLIRLPPLPSPLVAFPPVASTSSPTTVQLQAPRQSKSVQRLIEQVGTAHAHGTIAQSIQSDKSFFRHAAMRVALQWHGRQTAIVWARHALVYNDPTIFVLKDYLPNGISTVTSDPEVKSGSCLQKFCKILEDKIEYQLAANPQKPGTRLSNLKSSAHIVLR